MARHPRPDNLGGGTSEKTRYNIAAAALMHPVRQQSSTKGGEKCARKLADTVATCAKHMSHDNRLILANFAYFSTPPLDGSRVKIRRTSLIVNYEQHLLHARDRGGRGTARPATIFFVFFQVYSFEFFYFLLPGIRYSSGGGKPLSSSTTQNDRNFSPLGQMAI